jgi:hypothetical protein
VIHTRPTPSQIAPTPTGQGHRARTQQPQRPKKKSLPVFTIGWKTTGPHTLLGWVYTSFSSAENTRSDNLYVTSRSRLLRLPAGDILSPSQEPLLSEVQAHVQALKLTIFRRAAIHRTKRRATTGSSPPIAFVHLPSPRSPREFAPLQHQPDSSSCLSSIIFPASIAVADARTPSANPTLIRHSACTIVCYSPIFPTLQPPTNTRQIMTRPFVVGFGKRIY